MGRSPGSGDSSIITAFHTALLQQGALIFLFLVILFAIWNVLRSIQYRNQVSAGKSSPTIRPAVGPEPRARRVLRIGLAGLWIIDGFLQLQQGMPLGFPSNVLQPSAASSPGWVRAVVGFGVTTWSRHPTEAAASTVWIQLGIGFLLLVAPRGRWSRAAGLVSAGWGLVVWIFGEAFGGIFAPGLTILFGAPGGVLFYVLAGGLLTLSYRAWNGPDLGRMIGGALGVFLLVMAGLQAWPGRGFWQGKITAHSGTLAGMVRQMAKTPQPHLLSTAVSAFAAFDEANGLVVNLCVVLALAAIGLALVWGGRMAFPALVGLVVFGIADWILIEDFGVWGGFGTDPNSMLPMLLIAICGYLAIVRIPHEVPVAPVPVVENLDAPHRGWWVRIEPGYAARLAAALGALGIVLVGSAPMVAASVNPTTDPILADSVNGAPNVTNARAPNFHLVDQNDRPVSLGDLRGYTVVLTFLDPVCTTDCPVIAQELRLTSHMLGSAANKVRFVAIAANPTYNSVGVVAAFDRQEDLDSQTNWLFLTGSKSTLRPIWNAYGVDVIASPAGGMAGHSDVAYVIDSHGNTRRVIDADPGDGESDHASFSNILATQITQVMNS